MTADLLADSAVHYSARHRPPNDLHLPYGSKPVSDPAGTQLAKRHHLGRPAALLLAAVRSHDRHGLPHCDWIPVFSSIFAQDTIANSAYNSFQASLEKRFAHGLQFTAAYTFSKSFDQASSFEGILNPMIRAPQPLSVAFDARHRIVLSYYWDLPIHEVQRFKREMLEWLGRFRHHDLPDGISDPHHVVG